MPYLHFFTIKSFSLTLNTAGYYWIKKEYKNLINRICHTKREIVKKQTYCEISICKTKT